MDPPAHQDSSVLACMKLYLKYIVSLIWVNCQCFFFFFQNTNKQIPTLSLSISFSLPFRGSEDNPRMAFSRSSCSMYRNPSLMYLAAVEAKIKRMPDSSTKAETWEEVRSMAVSSARR